MDNQIKQSDNLKDNDIKPDSNHKSINSPPLHQVDDEQTEELITDPLQPKIKKQKKLYFIIGSVVGIILLIGLTFFILVQMKTSEINKSLDLGEKYLEEGKYEDAIIAFDSVIAIDPKQVPAYEGKAEVYVATQNYDDAEESLIKAREIAPSSKTNLLLVDVYDHTQKPDQAKKLLEETVTLLEADIKQTTDKTELTKLYDELIFTCQRMGKDSEYMKNLCDRALKATGDTKYEILKNNIDSGNSVGNLMNHAWIVQQGDWIYLSDIKMNSNGTEKLKTTNFKGTSVNLVGDWIYYLKVERKTPYEILKHGLIYKIRTNGTDETRVGTVTTGYVLEFDGCMQVVGDWIYFINEDNSLCKIRTDGTEVTKLKEKVGTNLGSYVVVSNDWIYYRDENSSLCKMRTDGTAVTTVIKESCYTFDVEGDWIYYANGDMRYFNLHKIRTDGSEEVTLISDQPRSDRINIDYGEIGFNVVGEWIYYNDISQGGFLYKLRIDGTQKTLLNNLECKYVNVVDQWVYFTTILPNNTRYRIQTDGTNCQKLD